MATQERFKQWRLQESGLRLSLQIIGAIVAILFLFWLRNILESHPGGWTSGTIEGWMSRTAWIIVILVILVLLTLMEALLFGPVKQKLRPLPIGFEEYADLTLGCPPCGTVFDYRTNFKEDGSFACPNCRRHGVLHYKDPVGRAVMTVGCTNCSHEYKAYHQESECPSCHTDNIEEKLPSFAPQPL